MNFKKLLALVICLIMMISCMSVAALAATDSTASVSVSTESTDVKIGDTVTFTVAMNAENIHSYACTISVSGELELVDKIQALSNGGFKGDLSVDKYGNYTVSSIGNENGSFTGTIAIAEVQCKVNGVGAVSATLYPVGEVYDEMLGKIKIDLDPTSDDKAIKPVCDHNPGAAADCTNAQVCTICGDVIQPALGHDMAAATCSEAAQCKRAGCGYTEGKALGHDWVGNVCTRCGQVQGEYFVDVELSDPETVASAWVDGKESDFSVIAGGIRVYLEDAKATNLVIYTYNDPNAVDLHTQYPIGMRVWLLAFDNGAYTATYVPEFDNLLQYSGSSIRIVGVKGIRMITSISKAKRYALMTGGLAGYTLEEYGTCLAWASEVDSNNPLVLGKEYTKSNYAYKKDVADPIFLDTGDLIQYTNVLVGFTDDQCIPDIVMRPYIILKNADGQELTIYGGQVCRSIGYIAWQNRNIFPAGSAEYAYVWNIIHHVYGDQYDAEYKG